MGERVIGAFTFPTRKTAEREIRRILHESPLGAPLGGSYYELIAALAEHHPDAAEKIGAGIASIEVRQIEHGSRGFWITRADGSTCDFSYRKALDGTPNRRQLLLRTLRSEIRDDIDGFRREWFTRHADADGRVTCPLTGQPMTLGPWAHVDHVAPTFAELADRFTAILGGPDAIPIEPATDRAGTRLRDRGIAELWRRYHNDNATLRVIHASANLARGYRRSRAA
jgi:hypothetical protein